MKDQYAVIGNPIHHSWSPKIHQLFAEQTQQELDYKAILAPLDGFKHILKEFQNQGGKGLNITLPFKQQAYQIVDTLSERAKLAKSINTIQFNPDGTLFGDNTDGIGFIRDVVHNHNFSISNKRVLILGAGGAVRGILHPLLQESPAQLIIANRTEETAKALIEEFPHDPSIQTCSLSSLDQFKFDLVINGTSASLTENTIDLPKNILSGQAYCYDMVYGKGTTPFMAWAAENNAMLISDGLGMLIEQAAESFYIWRGIRPKTLNFSVLLLECSGAFI
ncbi:MAG TPA: shikimate dehydrogenase [Gammaproteobacteria bacterium]|nr:shikimate dehydrogenase [Gammaproteobacteria bacterium]